MKRLFCGKKVIAEKDQDYSITKQKLEFDYLFLFWVRSDKCSDFPAGLCLLIEKANGY